MWSSVPEPWLIFILIYVATCSCRDLLSLIHHLLIVILNGITVLDDKIMPYFPQFLFNCYCFQTFPLLFNRVSWSLFSNTSFISLFKFVYFFMLAVYCTLGNNIFFFLEEVDRLICKYWIVSIFSNFYK